MLEPSAYGVHQPKIYGHIKKEIARCFGIQGRIIQHPAPNPVCLLRQHLPFLQTQDYVVSEKSDGVRFLFFLTHFSTKDQTLAIMINRAWDMYQMEVFAPKEFFRGTLFDGELVFDKKKHCLKYLVFDVVCFQGEDTKDKNLKQRHKLIADSFPCPEKWNSSSNLIAASAQTIARENKIVVVPDPKNLVFMYYKPQAQITDFESLTKLPPSHDSDGYIFTPIHCPVLQGTHEQMFKYGRNRLCRTARSAKWLMNICCFCKHRTTIDNKKNDEVKRTSPTKLLAQLPCNKRC
jgi:hypothetical protein